MSRLAGREYLFEGVVRGVITESRQGEDGFGYDPVFMPDGYDRTFAQMTMEEKNQISHRGRAVAKLVEFLLQADI
jgi:XTP/dITP diphosphohydrolase